MTGILALLDTNTLSDIVRRPRGRAATEVSRRGMAGLCTSILCAAELRLWSAKQGRQSLSGRIAELLRVFPVLAFEAPADVVYAELRARLERERRVLGAHDMFIAAHALALGAVLVTHDGAFRRVPGLAVEDWLA